MARVITDKWSAKWKMVKGEPRSEPLEVGGNSGWMNSRRRVNGVALLDEDYSTSRTILCIAVALVAFPNERRVCDKHVV